jgi:hypothetical protein
MWDGNHWWTGCNIIIIIIMSFMLLQTQRLQMCNNKGFKAVLVEHANQGYYDVPTLGFTAPNTSYHQYYQWLSGAARSYGMAFGLHAGSDLVYNNPYFVTFLDFASSSSCWGGSFCGLYNEVKAGESR